MQPLATTTAINPVGLILFIIGLMSLAVIFLGGLTLCILSIIAFFKRRNGLGLGLLLGGLAVWFGPPLLVLGTRALSIQSTPVHAWQRSGGIHEAGLGTFTKLLVVVSASASQVAVLVAIVSGIAMIGLLIAQQRRGAMLALRSLGICVLIVTIGGAVAASASGWSMTIVAMVLGLSVGAALIWVSVRCMPAPKPPSGRAATGVLPLPAGSSADPSSDEWRKMEAMDAGS